MRTTGLTSLAPGGSELNTEKFGVALKFVTEIPSRHVQNIIVKCSVVKLIMLISLEKCRKLSFSIAILVLQHTSGSGIISPNIKLKTDL